MTETFNLIALHPSSPLAGEERDLARNELSRSGEGACDSSRETPTAPSPRLARATSCQANLSSPAGGEGNYIGALHV